VGFEPRSAGDDGKLPLHGSLAGQDHFPNFSANGALQIS
jgi:hypothetical protein